MARQEETALPGISEPRWVGKEREGDGNLSVSWQGDTWPRICGDDAGKQSSKLQASRAGGRVHREVRGPEREAGASASGTPQRGSPWALGRAVGAPRDWALRVG